LLLQRSLNKKSAVRKSKDETGIKNEILLGSHYSFDSFSFDGNWNVCFYALNLWTNSKDLGTYDDPEVALKNLLESTFTIVKM
jgi:hypothetical protein